MPTFIDGETTVAEARDMDAEDAIERATGLAPTTIRAKLREANGNMKLRNLFFRQWPDRVDEIAGWTASFALQRDVVPEIALFTSLSSRLVKARLEGARGNTLVENVFTAEWLAPTDNPEAASDAESNSYRSPPNRLTKLDGEDDRSREHRSVATQDAPRTAMLRRYDLRRARAVPAGREPAPHQHEALQELHTWFESNLRSEKGGILALPTGGGKTFTTVRFLCEGPLSNGFKVLWLAHTHHLLEQAIDAFGPAEASPSTPLEVGHVREPRNQLAVRVLSATPGHFPLSTLSSSDDVAIATLQTIVGAYNRGHGRLTEFLESAKGKLIVVFDEAHHAPAPSYCKLLERLRQDHPALWLLGLTATPTYSDERRQGWLKKLFPQDVLFTVSRSRLIAAGVLSKPHFENCRTEISVELSPGDYQRWLSSYGDCRSMSSQSWRKIASATTSSPKPTPSAAKSTGRH